MRVLVTIICVAGLIGCAGGGDATSAGPAAAPERALIQVEAPAALEIPAPVELASDTDWEGRAHNKDIEIIEVLNVVNPVAAYITAGFEQYGERFSDGLNEEWVDTQVQLTAALTLMYAMSMVPSSTWSDSLKTSRNIANCTSESSTRQVSMGSPISRIGELSTRASRVR